MPRRARCLFLVAVLSGCGMGQADVDRAEILARTCLSTIIRNGLPAPDPAKIAPQVFEDERERLLASGRQFNTVSPYRNVCRRVRDDLRAATSVAPADQVAEPDDPADGGSDSSGPTDGSTP